MTVEFLCSSLCGSGTEMAPRFGKMFQVNPELITIKLFYFCTLSALATLLPYLPIFLTQIGIQQKELASIYFLIFFLTFFKNIVIGFIADKYQWHKAILILSCVFTGPLYATLLAVPPAAHDTNISATLTYLDSQLVVLNSSDICIDHFTDVCQQRCDQLSQESSFKNSLTVNLNFTYLANGIEGACNVSSDVFCQCTKPEDPPPYTSFTFWICLTIGVSAALCGSNELMMNDAIALNILGDDRKQWGMSRMWGSLGYGLTAVTVSVLIERLGQLDNSKIIDYTPSFYIYLVLSLSSGVIAYFHPTRGVVKSAQALKGIGKVLCDVRVISFLLIIFALGFYNGIIITYLFLYLRTELLATQLCLGLCVFTTVLVEVPIFFIGGRIVEKVGAMACLYLALLAYGVRFLAYVYIPTAWWAIMVETLHMFTFGLMFTAANMYASKVTAEGYLGTMLGLVNGIKWGLGIGLGSLLGTSIASCAPAGTGQSGFKFLFTACSISCAVLLVLFVIVNEVIIRYGVRNPSVPHTADGNKNAGVTAVTDSQAHSDLITEKLEDEALPMAETEKLGEEQQALFNDAV